MQSNKEQMIFNAFFLKLRISLLIILKTVFKSQGLNDLRF